MKLSSFAENQQFIIKSILSAKNDADLVIISKLCVGYVEAEVGKREDFYFKRGAFKINWLVLCPNSRTIYYEAISEEDAKNNCPKGYIVQAFSDAALEELVLSN